MALTPQEYGRQAELRAIQYLASQGYSILAHRFKTRHGEIDIVALEGEQLVFVEVKARQHRLAEPELAVGPKKLSAIARAAHCYLAEINDPERGFRVELIAVHGTELRHHKDLFGL